MRSCASRGARSPGSARNRSSCSRSDRLSGGRIDMRSRTISGAAGRHGRAEHGGMPLGGQHGPDAGIGGRGLGAALGPGLQIVERDRRRVRRAFE